jgi:micrococcal nuclease
MGITGSSKTKTLAAAILLLVAGVLASLLGAESEFEAFLGDVLDTPRAVEESATRGALPVALPPLAAGQWYVERVVDGDTLIAAREGEQKRVRLIGIDTPESVHPTKPVECFGKEAAAYLQSLAEGHVVTLVFDESQGMTDAYNRTLAYVFLENDSTSLNEVMIAHGYAYEYTYDDAVPYQHQGAFVRAEEAARAAKQGLWADGACEL